MIFGLMENRLERSAGRLSTQIKKTLPGVAKYGEALNLPPGCGESLASAANDLEVADNYYLQSRDELTRRHAALKRKFKSCAVFCTLLRELLKPTIGPKYSLSWEAVGFVDSLRIPITTDGMVMLISAMGSYITAYPEAANASADITAERAKALHDELVAARTAVAEGRSDCERAFKARAQKIKTGRSRLRSLIDDLEQAMEPLDWSWIEFGLNQPGVKATPEVPENVSVELITPDTAALKWDRPPRAEYYHVHRRIVGVDEQMVLVGSPRDEDFTAENLPANATIEFALSAVNERGESQLSEVITIITGIVVDKGNEQLEQVAGNG